MEQLILYSTGCPKCNVLKKKLLQKNIPFQVISDINEIKKTGYLSVPILKIGDNYFDFIQANNWINNQ